MSKILNPSLVYERVSYVAYEGSQVCLLGTMNFDGKKWTMTNVAAIIGGGLNECRKYMRMEALGY